MQRKARMWAQGGGGQLQAKERGSTPDDIMTLKLQPAELRENYFLLLAPATLTLWYFAMASLSTNDNM